MRITLLATAVLFFGNIALSQVRFSLFAGPQMSFASYTVQYVKQETSSKAGFHAGMGMKVPVEGRLYFAPAIYYSMKGYKVVYNRFAYPPGPEALDNNTTFHTVETAVLAQYDFNDREDHFFFRVGPSIDFQLFGKEKFHTNNGDVDRSTPFGFDKYGHFAANMIFQLGYETPGGVFINGQYSHGLASINNADYGPRIRHRVLGISIGKYLGK